MPDDPPLFRQWTLLTMLASRRYGASLREMADEAGVCPKTIRRDIKLFKDLGFPIEETVGERGRKAWQMDRSAVQTPIAFNYQEALALYFARRLLDPLFGTPFGTVLQSAYRKIRASLGKDVLDFVDRVADRFCSTSLGVSDYTQKDEVIDELNIAIEESKQAVITYTPLRATEPVEYEILPYGLVQHRGSLYLVAYSRDHRQIRHFKLDRLESVERRLDLPFRRPDDFDLQEHLRSSFGVFHGAGDIRVKIEFLPSVARYVLEKRWHPSQKLTKRRDGSVLARFRLSATEEIKSWVLGFGPHARILSPKALKEEIARDLRSALAGYEQHPPGKRSRAVEDQRAKDQTDA